MLRLLLLSNMHFEFRRDEPLLRLPLKGDFDVLVIPGDTGDVTDAIKSIDRLLDAFPTTPVVYVAGNRDFSADTTRRASLCRALTVMETRRYTFWNWTRWSCMDTPSSAAPDGAEWMGMGWGRHNQLAHESTLLYTIFSLELAPQYADQRGAW